MPPLNNPIILLEVKQLISFLEEELRDIGTVTSGLLFLSGDVENCGERSEVVVRCDMELQALLVHNIAKNIKLPTRSWAFARCDPFGPHALAASRMRSLMLLRTW